MARSRERPVLGRMPLARSALTAGVALAAALLLPARAVPEQAGTSARAVVRAFYAYHMAHNAGFTPAALKRRARWLSPGLLARCRTYFATPQPPDEVPPIDGDPFTDSQDYPTAFRIGGVTEAGDTARVRVTLTWPGPGGDRRTVTAVLLRAVGAWRIDDVRPGDGPSLRELLAARP